MKKRTPYEVFEDILYILVLIFGIVSFSWVIARVVQKITSIHIDLFLAGVLVIVIIFLLSIRAERKVKEKDDLIRYYEEREE